MSDDRKLLEFLYGINPEALIGLKININNRETKTVDNVHTSNCGCTTLIFNKLAAEIVTRCEDGKKSNKLPDNELWIVYD